MVERRSLDGGSRRRTENGADDAEDLPAEEQYEPEHGHTLSAMQGRGMRRELSRHTFFGVEGFEGEPVVTADPPAPVPDWFRPGSAEHVSPELYEQINVNLTALNTSAKGSGGPLLFYIAIIDDQPEVKPCPDRKPSAQR